MRHYPHMQKPLDTITHISAAMRSSVVIYRADDMGGLQICRETARHCCT